MPRQTLNREQIVAAAIELLDAEGLDGLNMRALGERLGSAATAVYWHVENKANLVVLAGDEVWNEVPLPHVLENGWRSAAHTMATGLHAMLTRHPWLVQAFGSYVVFGPGMARHHDHTLGVFEAAGLSAGDADRAATTVFTYVLGSALGPAAAASMRRRLEQTGGDSEALLEEMMARAADIARGFPRLAARLGSAASAYAAGPEDTFEFGLVAILDGIAVQLPGRGAGTN